MSNAWWQWNNVRVVAKPTSRFHPSFGLPCREGHTILVLPVNVSQSDSINLTARLHILTWV